ncbi:MAG: HDOD domain-containing protein [Burkholderiaceae bacterium]
MDASSFTAMPEMGGAQLLALADLDGKALQSLVRDIGIPARPQMLVDLQTELELDDPSLRAVSDIVGSDVALSAALLKTANSPLMGLSRRAETVEQAFQLLGFAQCQALLTEVVLRKLLPADGPGMVRFWDVSAKRARAMTFLARTRHVVPPALAHTYGLFAEVGIAILLQRFPARGGYLATLDKTNAHEGSITALEQSIHGVDHALVGALTARTWGVSQTTVLATRLHHEYPSWMGPMPPQVRELIALGLVCETIIQRYQDMNRHIEWRKGGDTAMAALGIDESELESWCEDVHDQFAATGI